MRQRRAVLRLWRAASIYGILLLAFAVLALCARLYPYFSWDLRITRFLQNLPVPGLLGLMQAVSWIGNGWTPFLITLLTTLAFLWIQRRPEAAGLLLSAGGGELINGFIKWIIARPRPSSTIVSVFHPLTTQSFPSGHVTFYVGYFGFLFFVAYAHLPKESPARRLALILTPVPILLVGLSRIYLGAHWPSDTLGAYLFSVAWLGLTLRLYRRWSQPEARL